MKGTLLLGLLCVAVLAVMVFQAGRQELELHNLRSRMAENAEDFKRKEKSILDLKTKIGVSKSELVSVNNQINELKKKKQESENSVAELNKNLQGCNTEKVRS